MWKYQFQGVVGEQNLFLNRKKIFPFPKKAKISSTCQQSNNIYLHFMLPGFDPAEKERNVIFCFKKTFFVLTCLDKRTVILPFLGISKSETLLLTNITKSRNTRQLAKYTNKLWVR